MNEPNNNKKFPRCGEIWLTRFEKLKESRKPYRPCLIISNDEQNELDEWIVVAPLTTDYLEDIRLTDVFVENTPENGLTEPSKIQLNYPFTADKELRLIERLGKIDSETMNKVNIAWEKCLWLKKVD
jgi:mRNA-degrading endonuclease toxin of MazEF toxin-antitoxin module